MRPHRQIELRKASGGAVEEPIGLSGTDNGSFSGRADKSQQEQEQSQGILVWMEIKMTMECQFTSHPTVTHKLPVTVLCDRSTLLASNLN